MSELKGKTLMFTGTLKILRAEATQKAQDAGAKVTVAISGKTDIVVIGEGAGAKVEQAKSKGITVWTEAEFLAKLAQEGG
jgi:DNA ligase (NAD+)